MQKHLIVRLDVKETTTYGLLRDALAADPGRPDYGLTPAQAAQLRASGAVKFSNATLVDVSCDKEQ